MPHAPEPLRRRAEEVAARVAWVAVPLRVWAARVHAFNRTVDELLAQYRQDLLGPADRGRLVHELHLKYFEAVRYYLEEGERDFVAMLRGGPTPDHLALARHLGALPAGSMLPTRWERSAALDEAQRLIATSSDPAHRPTEAELARLGEIVGRFAHQDEFSCALLRALGPAGLNALIGRLALLPADPHGVDDRLVELAGSIQADLGVVLATATTRRDDPAAHPPSPHQPGGPELPEQWVTDLLRAARQQHRYRVPTGEQGYRAAEFYGHQLLAVLLQSPDTRFDTTFLDRVGTDLYHFDQATGRPAPGPLPLNWINGGTGNDGYDPMIGLLDALHRNPEAARAFFTGTAGNGETLPRVGYLLAERQWPPDHRYRGGTAPGYRTLGQALETAVATDPANLQSIQIIEQTVAALCEKPPNSDLVPPNMREAIANMLCPYIADLNERYRADAPDLGGLGAWAGGGEAAASALRGLDRLLTDLGKHERAAATVSATQLHFSAIELERYLTAATMSVQQRVAAIRNVLGAHAEVMAHLDRGAIEDADEATPEQLARLKRRSRAEQRVVEAIVGQPLPASPIPRPPPAASRQLLHLMAYVLVPPDDPLHDALLPGLPGPLRAAKVAGREWTGEDRTLWARYVDAHPDWPDG